MTISSVTPSSPPQSPSSTTDTKPPATKATGDANAPSWQPPAKSPLPPGQGTRIDQLV